MEEDRIREIIREEIETMLGGFLKRERYVFSKGVQFLDGRNIQIGTSIGTKLGTATTQKLGFFNATPVDQPATISDPAGQSNDLDSEARATIAIIIDRLQELGLIQ